MVNGLKKHGLNTSKLKTFNGDIKKILKQKKNSIYLLLMEYIQISILFLIF